MLKWFLNIGFLLLPALSLDGQDTVMHKVDSVPDRIFILENVTRDGETLPEIKLDEINVVKKVGLKERFQWWRYQRLVHNVKKVYPYALVVRGKFTEINDTLQKIEGEKARKQFLKEFETGLFGEYEDDIRHMTITQGRILIKLIDRETRNTSYEIIRDYRGSLSAFFWQGIARIFGSNLKSEYEPEGEDYLIEKVIYEIEHGRL
ncbi:MAG: DUF4294 domain-containing protein [Bacteroidales bacterium]|nr:DUF4294 domain-containing protein [Bacteroidales bacterium]